MIPERGDLDPETNPWAAGDRFAHAFWLLWLAIGVGALFAIALTTP